MFQIEKRRPCDYDAIRKMTKEGKDNGAMFKTFEQSMKCKFPEFITFVELYSTTTAQFIGLELIPQNQPWHILYTFVLRFIYTKPAIIFTPDDWKASNMAVLSAALVDEYMTDCIQLRRKTSPIDDITVFKVPIRLTMAASRHRLTILRSMFGSTALFFIELMQELLGHPTEVDTLRERLQSIRTNDHSFKQFDQAQVEKFGNEYLSELVYTLFDATVQFTCLNSFVDMSTAERLIRVFYDFVLAFIYSKPAIILSSDHYNLFKEAISIEFISINLHLRDRVPKPNHCHVPQTLEQRG